MHPEMARGALTMVMLCLVLSTVSIVLSDPGSPRFLAAAVALIFSLLFLAVVVREVRKEAAGG